MKKEDEIEPVPMELRRAIENALLAGADLPEDMKTDFIELLAVQLIEIMRAGLGDENVRIFLTEGIESLKQKSMLSASVDEKQKRKLH